MRLPQLLVTSLGTAAALARGGDPSSGSRGSSSSPSGYKIVPKLYSCNESTGFCEQLPLGASSAPQGGSSQQICLLTCRGTLWPAPAEIMQMVTGSTSDFCGIEFTVSDGAGAGGERKYASAQETQEAQEMSYERIAIDNFVESLSLVEGSEACGDTHSVGVLKVIMKNTNPRASANDPLTLQTDESYSLHISVNSEGNPEATISSASFYGGRHGLETLSQLIATDTDPLSPNYGVNTIANAVQIKDAPAFPYRGILLDTSRHYLSMKTIKAVIRGMGYNKLNRLHLHLTDTASFPLQVPTEPNLFMYGGYSSSMFYDEARIQDLMEYAHGFGVSIVPEIDVPSHVNMGWNWGQLEGLGDLAICTTDWTDTALEPPAGHLNIANPAVYPILHNIYSFLGKQFEYPDIFHIGGDEVVVGSDTTTQACWNSTEYGRDILELLGTLGLSRGDQESFYTLWHKFTHRIVDMISDVYTSATVSFSSPTQDTSSRSPPKNIIWGGNVEPNVGDSPVTYNMVARPDVVQELPPNEYIMEIWDDSADSIAPSLLEQGYDVIAANYDYVYMDCGQPGFTNPGGYWCGPYHEWSHVYQYLHDMQAKWDLTPDGHSKAGTGRIIGSEVLLWGEENGDSSVEAKLFPRAAALAEGLWSNPQPIAPSGTSTTTNGSHASITDSDRGSSSSSALWYKADPRMQLWRNTLAARGVGAAAMQPLWCTQRGPYSCTTEQGVPQ